MKQQSLFRWPRVTRMPLALEISLVLIIKFVIIFLLWKTFFSKPQAKKMLVPMPQMEQHLLSGLATKHEAGPVTDQITPPTSHTRPEEKHGSN